MSNPTRAASRSSSDMVTPHCMRSTRFSTVVPVSAARMSRQESGGTNATRRSFVIAARARSGGVGASSRSSEVVLTTV